ncbi:MAG: hypothetical protein HY831_00020 [Candidatus Aenigmarchaeota archaeon]|nr:hypothetical protein [Candidatus Aenigmarchaeota archaeon]
MKDKTTISINRETKELLNKIGNKGQKYEDIVKQLCEFYLNKTKNDNKKV